jgi:hypothetical protein
MVNRNRYFARFAYFLRKNRRLLTITTFIVLLVNIILYSNSTPKIILDETYEGTFKGKYLKSIKDVRQLESDEFYQKWSVIGYLDDLVNEPIEPASFHNSIDPFTIVEEYEHSNKEVIYKHLSLLEKAKVYANEILPKSEFTFKDIQDIIYKDAYYSKKFIGTRLKKWLKIKQYLTENEQNLLGVNDDWFRDAVTQLKDKKLDHNLISANEIKYSLTHLKFFSNLFLKPELDQTLFNSVDTPEFSNICSTISKKLFNWLSNEYPIFTKYDKQLQPTKINPYISTPDLQESCFIKSLQLNLSGKGIVITSNDALVPELSGLLSLLRITGNTYPIQIFHNNDLSLESIKILNDIANEPIMKLPKEIPEFKIPKKIPTLDLIFVDVSEVIHFKYKKYFNSFGMKLLAYLFNSFEEMIMLDTDTVIVENIDDFFNTFQYSTEKAFFFRDRNVNSFLYEGIVDYFKSYLNYDKEVHYLNLPRVSDETLNNRFFGAFARHYMESGLFVINKKEKFDGVVTSVIIQMFKLFSGSLHGEKEFIWLGQEIMGNSYSFNSNAAIAIGELSPESEMISKELCTTHPAHIDDKFNLLWFNSGFLNCKKYEAYYKDINYERNQDKTLIELKKEYLSPLHITHGLIPPPAEYTVKSSTGEPTRGWTMTQQCSNYMWCAYNIIGGANNLNIPKGEVISFESISTKKWDYLGRLWVNYYNKGYLKGSDHGYIEGDAYDELGLEDLDVFTGDKMSGSRVYPLLNDGENDNSNNNEINEEKSVVSEETEQNESVDDIDAAPLEAEAKTPKEPVFPKVKSKLKPKAGARTKSRPTILEEENEEEKENDKIINLEDEELGISKEVKEDSDGYYI